MERLSMERLRSPRRSSGSNLFYPESGNNSGSSTPYMSAPSSPRGDSYYYYYSAPPTPPRDRSEDSSEAAVPFAWEDKPGTPKSGKVNFRFGEKNEEAGGGGMKNSVDHLTGMGFHFSSAPVSPQREFDFMNGNQQNQVDEFEFSSARISDADSVVSHADELFFQGQILPLKLPPRLQHKSSVSLSLQLQEFSPRSSDHKSEFSPRGGAPGAVLVHQLHSPRTPKSGLSRPPAAYGYGPKSPSTPKYPFKVGSQDENKSPSKRSSQPQRAATTASSSSSSIRRTLKELLHLNTKSSNNVKVPGMKKQDSVNSSGTDSQKSSRSSSSSSHRFSDSRSSSVSSNKSLGSARSSFSSKQVSPAPHDFMHGYNRNHKTSNADELRRRTFLPYKQGLLGCISCISADAFRDLHELRK